MKIVDTFKHEEVRGFKFGSIPVGKPRLFSHIYFIDGLLIDTGHSKMRKSILTQIEELDIEQIFITHHHEDHTGNLKPLQKIINCKVYGSELCSKLMQDPPTISLGQRIVWGDREAVNFIEPKVGSIVTRNHIFEIIPIPGHAPDMVALYERKKKWLFSADLYLNSHISYILNDENIMEQIKSIEKILKLDFEVLFCSHNPKFKNGKKALLKKRKFLLDFVEEVSSLYSKGFKPTQIFKKMNLKEQWLTKLTTLGKLSKLNMVKSVINAIE